MTSLARSSAPTAAPARAGGAVGRRRGRVAAVLTVACALGHVPMLLSHPDMSPWLALLMAVVALACLGCVRSLAFGPTRGTWLVVLTLSLTMVALHAPMVLSGHGNSAESQAVDPASSTSAHGEHGEQGGTVSTAGTVWPTGS